MRRPTRRRFTPRKPTSIWSAVNIRRAEALQALGHMTPLGLQAFALRREAKSRIDAHEQTTHAELTPADQARFRKNQQAWAFFEAQPPGYRHRVAWQVLSAKRQETRQSRLDKLILACATPGIPSPRS